MKDFKFWLLGVIVNLVLKKELLKTTSEWVEAAEVFNTRGIFKKAYVETKIKEGFSQKFTSSEINLAIELVHLLKGRKNEI